MLRMNHMEITVPAGTLARDGDNLAQFLSEIFGFEPQAFPGELDMPGMTYSLDPDGEQFLFVAEHAQPLPRASDDHLGLHAETAAEVEAMIARAQQWQQRDPRVEIRDFGLVDFGQWKTRAVYLRYILPIWFDVQNIAGPPPRAGRWEYVPTP